MTESNPKTIAREEFYQLNKSRLERLAFNATQRGMSRHDFVVLAIDVDDPEWQDLVEFLMPNQDWDQVRARGEKPVARGSVEAGITDYISMVVPGVASSLALELPEATVRCIIMTAGGASVYHITPDVHLELN